MTNEDQTLTPALSRPAGRGRMLLLAGLLAITAVVFGRAITHDFIAWDDQSEIYLNPDYKSVTWKGLAWNWTHTRMSVWMPLTYYVWGAVAAVSHQPPDANGIALHPGPFHAACVVFHLAAVALVFLVLRRLIRSDRPALIGAAVFALHPIQVEAVAWVSGMYTVLSTVFSLAAIEQYLRAGDAESSRRRWVHFALSTLFFCAGLLTKPSTIALPAMVAAIHVLLIRNRWRQLMLMLAIWVPLSAAVFLYARTFHAAELVPALSIAQKLFVAGDTAGFYLARIAWPTRFIPDYGRFPEKVLANREWFWIAPLALLMVSAAMFRRAPRAVAAAAIFFIGVGPFLGLVKFDYQFYSTVSDRYAYAAMFGVALASAVFVAHWRKQWIDALAVGCALALALLSFNQMRHWRDTQTLFDYTLSIRPDSLIANKVLGVELELRDPDRALKCYQAAITERPTDATAHFNYARLLAYTGSIPQAIAQWEEVLRIRPQDYRALSNLGVAATKQRHYGLAEEYFHRAIDAADQLNEPFVDGHQNLGLLLIGEGRKAEAIEHLEAALKINPDLPRARQALESARKNTLLVP